MNDLQTLFTIVFGIYFATSVSSSGRFWPFDTTAAMAGDLRALSRLVVAFTMLNILPFAYLMAALWWLRRINDPLFTSPLKALGAFFAGLGGAGIYRVFLAVVLSRRSNDPSSFVFYSKPDELAQGFAGKAAIKKQPPDDAQEYPSWSVAWGGLLWLAVCVGIFVLLTWPG